MLVVKMAKTIVNILKLSPTHFASNFRHQPYLSPISYDMAPHYCPILLGILKCQVQSITTKISIFTSDTGCRLSFYKEYFVLIFIIDYH